MCPYMVSGVELQTVMLHTWVSEGSLLCMIMCCRGSQLNLKPLKSLVVFNNILIVPSEIQANKNKFNEYIRHDISAPMSSVNNSLKREYEEMWNRS